MKLGLHEQNTSFFLLNLSPPPIVYLSKLTHTYTNDTEDIICFAAYGLCFDGKRTGVQADRLCH